MGNDKIVNLDALDKIAKELRKKALADISQQEEEIAKLRDEMIILEEDINDINDLKADKSELFSGDYNDLKNKPCGGGEVRSVIAEYDCVEEGKEEGWFQKGPWTYNYYVKVADLTEAEYNQIISSLLESSSKLSMEYKNKETGEIRTVEYEIDRDYITETDSDFIMLSYQNIVITKKATSYSEGSYGGNWKFDSAGVFFNTQCLVYTDETESDYYYADCLKCEIVKESDLKQLDEKFIPDTIARVNDLPTYDDTTIKNELAKKVNTEDLSTVATSGSYNDLTNKPDIPMITNDLTDELKSNYDTAYEHSQSGTINMNCIDGFSGELLVAHSPSKGENSIFFSTKAYITSSGSIGTENNMNAKAFYEDGIALANKYAAIEYVNEEIAKLRDEMIILEEDDLTTGGLIDNTFPSLTTEDKTLLGAINEINSKANDGISRAEMNEILMEVFGITLDEEGE